MRRHLKSLAVLACLIVAVAVGLIAARLWLAERPVPSYPPAETATAKATLSVGDNAQVSKTNDRAPHRECVAAADPRNSDHLYVASIFSPPEAKGERVVCYTSRDGGKSWQVALQGQADPGDMVNEPALAVGPDGTLYFVWSRVPGKTSASQGKTSDFGDPLETGGLEFARSADGGKTWTMLASVKQFTDRPWLVADCTEGPHRGRLYCPAYIRKIVLHASRDQGKTFAAPVISPINKGRYRLSDQFIPGNPVVLSDGTLVLVYDLRDLSALDRSPVGIVVSRDGGQSLEEAAPVTTGFPSNWTWCPQMAVDATTKEFHDRLYVVWMDGAHPEKTRVLFAYSKDKAKTWSRPCVLSEQADTEYGAYMPSIAVNKDGMVAVSWYDRRGLATPARGTYPRYPPGCNCRLRVSLDGGQTWLPSKQINDKTIKAPCEELKDTAGISADADGNFHPAWIDDRTGTRQVWTTKVKVEAKYQPVQSRKQDKKWPGSLVRCSISAGDIRHEQLEVGEMPRGAWPESFRHFLGHLPELP
jgi:hypothetical protein